MNDFLKNFSHATQLSYNSALKSYFEVINKDPEKYFKNGNRKYTDKELKSYENDVTLFWRKIKDKPPLTVRQYIGVIRVFLQDNYVDLPKKFWKSFKKRKKGSRTIIQDIVPTREQFKKIISHGSILEKAMVTTLLSSGMRIGELCLIKEEDIDFDFTPVKIEVKGEYTKTGNRRTVFVSDEASEFLKEWLKEKQEYLDRAVKILNFPQYTKSNNDDRVFPMHSGVARQKWNRLLRKSGLTDQDNSTSRPHYKIHPHVTRKYYRTWMAKDLGRDLTEYFLGHEEGLDAVYRRYGDDSNKQLLGDEYYKGMHNVMIFTTETKDINEIREQMKEKDKQLQDMQKTMDEMKAQILELRLEKLEKANERN